MLEKNSIKQFVLFLLKKKLKERKGKCKLKKKKKKEEELTMIDSSICVWRTPKAELHGKLIQA